MRGVPRQVPARGQSGRLIPVLPHFALSSSRSNPRNFTDNAWHGHRAPWLIHDEASAYQRVLVRRQRVIRGADTSGFVGASHSV